MLECRQPLRPGMRVGLMGTDEIVVGRGAERRVSREGRRAELWIDDDRMSRRHVVLRRVVAGWELVDAGSKNGTSINGDICARTTLADGDVIEVGSTMLVFRETGLQGTSAEAVTDRDLGTESKSRQPVVFRTLTLELERRLSQLSQVAPSRVPVLVNGESGTGKELVAQAVHDLSGRRGTLVPINCGALPRTLVESELFGYRRGAFSDAKDDREGLVRRANGGTLFLDEVAELPLESQVALLRFLQEGEVRPIGAVDAMKVDVRVIAATHQNITTRITEGRFRQDLYARLAGFQIALPPLRERREDLGTLIASTLEKLGDKASQVTLHRAAARALINYGYPLNIRELEQAFCAAVLFAQGGQIRVEHLPEELQQARPRAAIALKPEEHALRERLLETLRETRGNIAEAGRAMDKAPVQIRRWCRRYGIDLAKFRDTGS
jgi:DNA-binding NtrC family response regulator